VYRCKETVLFSAFHNRLAAAVKLLQQPVGALWPTFR
jgi:hypothetical protein